MQNRAIVGIMWMLLLLPFFAAEAAEKRLPTTFKSIRWQMLPGAIRHVVVGPDGRTWYQLESDPKDRPREEIRKSLEAEYRQANPQITGAALALLEPSGRAWFSANKGLELWGFDGKTWIERRTEKGAKFSGFCPTRGQLLDNLSNRFVGGRAWFRDEQGIHVFDGKAWHYRAIGPPNTAIPPKSAITPKPGAPAGNTPFPNRDVTLNTNVTELLRFAVSPNGKFAVALAPKYAWQLGGLKNPDVWFWKDTNSVWQKRQFSWNDQQGAVGTFCIADDGAMWCVQSGQLRKFFLGNAGDILDQLPKLLSDLDADDFAAREQAQTTLSAIAEQIQPQIAAALESTTASPEKKRRLTALQEQIREFKQGVGIRPGHGYQLGEFKAQIASSVFQDDAGKRYVFSTSILDRLGKIDHGFLVIGLDGAATLCSIGPGEKAGYGGGSLNSPVKAALGDALWITHGPREWPFISRFDFKTQKITAYVNDSAFHSIRAIDEKDRVYATSRNYNPLDDRELVLGLLSPDIPEGQGALPITRRTAEFSFLVAPDGVIWASDRSEGLLRHDGRQWEVVQSVSEGHMRPLLAGLAGYTLCLSGNDDYRLFRDKRLVASGPIKRLIATNREHFLAAFPVMFTPVQRGKPLWIASDSSRNIWLGNGHTVDVFCRYEWLATEDACRAAQITTNGAGTKMVTAVGYGNQVYFNSVLANVANDRVQIAQAPAATDSSNIPLGIRDQQGGLWLPSHRGSTGRYSPENFCTTHLNDQGLSRELPVSAWPVLLDRGNNLWLAQMGQSSASNHFWICRDDAVVQELEIPGSDAHHFIFSDKPGSVFVRTKWGLHHLLADQEGQFQLDDTYVMPSVEAFSLPMAYSEHVGIVFHAGIGNARELCFVELPES